ncbi:unnamed protein product, partial [Tetraodon nigroviridis]
DREALGELPASNDDLTASEDDLSEKNTTKVRSRMQQNPPDKFSLVGSFTALFFFQDKSIFSNMFKKPQKQAGKEKSGNLFSGLLRKTPKPAEETSDSFDREALGELPASNDDLTASEDDLSEKNTTKVRSRMQQNPPDKFSLVGSFTAFFLPGQKYF